LRARSIHPALLALVLVALGPGATDAVAAPSFKRTATRARAVRAAADGAYRAHVGRMDLFLPPDFAPVDGRYDVVLHFHGMARAQESNTVAAKLNAAVVSMNLGTASDKYRLAVQSPRAFEMLLAKTHRLVVASGRARGARIGRVALSAWSAGFESVSAILKQDGARARIDAVLLADGLHAALADKKRRVVEERSLGKYARLVEEATRGEKLFVLTHSSIPTIGYATVAETVDVMLRLAGVEKGPPPAESPRKMQAVYAVHRGDLHVTGFEGRGVSDHIDHIRAMGETMYPLLAARWSRKNAPEPT
jgi:hypothetical protein